MTIIYPIDSYSPKEQEKYVEELLRENDPRKLEEDIFRENYKLSWEEKAKH